MSERPRVSTNGAVSIGSLTIFPQDLHVRVTTSGGPGGQHANRTLSRVVVSFDVAQSSALTSAQRERLLGVLGSRVSASSSSSRSQTQNKALAIERLARKIADALHEDAPRRPTRPTRASVSRRLDDKKRRSSLKDLRRRSEPD
jgi:ribosome-associated protein